MFDGKHQWYESCAVCGYVRKQGNADNHNYNFNNNTGYYECAECDYSISWKNYCSYCREFKDGSDATYEVCHRVATKIEGKQKHWLGVYCYGNNAYGELLYSDTEEVSCTIRENDSHIYKCIYCGDVYPDYDSSSNGNYKS